MLGLGSKEIVGFSLSEKPDAQLATDALDHAVRRMKPDTSDVLFQVYSMPRILLENGLVN